MDTEILNQIGMNDSEIKVYFSLLELESSTVGPIVEKAKVTESKIYSILDKLIEKGLVSFVIKNNVKHFQASPPESLIRILDEREEQLQKQKKKIEKEIIPQIEARKQLDKDKQEATIYEGYEGVKTAMNLILKTLKPGDSYEVFMLGEALREKPVTRLLQNYHPKRIEKKLKLRLLTNKKHKDLVKEWLSYKDMKFRITDTVIPIGTFIYKDHVMTIIWEDKPTAFVIKSRKNYEYYKEFFEDVWKDAKSP